MPPSELCPPAPHITHIVEEAAVLGGPADLHDPAGDHGDLVVPAAGTDRERAPDALEGGRVTAGLNKWRGRGS